MEVLNKLSFRAHGLYALWPVILEYLSLFLRSGFYANNNNDIRKYLKPSSFKKTTSSHRPIFFIVIWLLILVTSSLSCGNIAYAGNPVTVIYPVYHNDADRIILEILDGLYEGLKNNITEIAFDPVMETKVIKDKIESLSDKDIIITLTSGLGDFVRSTNFKGQLIEGVSDSLAPTKSTLSVGIEPSPEIYIDSLRKLQPKISRIFYFILMNGKDNEKEAGKLRGITRNNQIKLEIKYVENIKDAMHGINNVIDIGDPSKDALWIPNQVLSMANNTVLKYVLREAWKKSFIVYTDSLDAVARGLLFSLIPDYRAYGMYLGQLSIDMTMQDGFPVSDFINYFNDVYLMLNQRFTIHLGLNINRSILGKYKIVVPAK